MKNVLLDQFWEFIQKYGVIGLAIGVVVGQSVTQLVASLVGNIITPIISLLLNFVLAGQQLATFEVWGIKLGQFLNDSIQFVLVIFVVYVAVRVFIHRFLSPEEKEKLNF